MDGIKATVTGIPDLREALRGIVPKLRVRALRNALAAGAREVQKAARSATPVINSMSLAVRKGYRKPGTVRKAISVRTSKVARAAGNVGVFVNVRPAKGAKFIGGVLKRASQRGAKSPNDPYYWHWLNFGWYSGGSGRYLKFGGESHRIGSKARHAGFRFLEAGADKLPQALQVFNAKIIPAIEKLNRPKAPAP